MRVRQLGILALPVLVLVPAPRPGCAQGKGSDQDKQAIAKNAEAFVEAFHKGDAKALAAFFTADADYTDQTGNLMKGRKAIENAFHSFFAENKGLKMSVTSASLRFLTPDVAVEDGTTEVFAPDGSPPSSARYTIVHVKTDSQWRLGSVREAVSAPASNYRQLRGLEWAVGDWVSEPGKGVVDRVTLEWTVNKNFLIGHFSKFHGNTAVGSIEQRIAWDPLAKRIRSWAFDETGGFGEGSWTQDGKSWQVKSTIVLPDGKKATGTLTLRPVDADTIVLQGTDRTVDGNPVPDSKEIKLKRVQ